MKVIRRGEDCLEFWADGGVVDGNTPTLDDYSEREVVTPAALIRATYGHMETERRRDDA